jgi:MoxR-like ATPase
VEPGDEHFDFRPGAVFSNIVLADEINRASPKTQCGAARGDGGGTR